MGAEADAGTIVLRLIGDGSSLNKTLRQAEAQIERFAKQAGLQFGKIAGKTLGVADLGLYTKFERYADSLKKIGIFEKRGAIDAVAASRMRIRAYEKLGKIGKYFPKPAEVHGNIVDYRLAVGARRQAAENEKAAEILKGSKARIARAAAKYAPVDKVTPGVLAARRVVDRPLGDVYAKRLADARKLGGPLSPMPGILGKIAGGFIEASKKKDAFAANVFAKMPPCFNIFRNVARGVGMIAMAFLSLPRMAWRVGSSIVNAFQNAIGSLQAFGTKLRTAGLYTTALITAPIVGMASSALASGSGFDKSMTEAVARAGTDHVGARNIPTALRNELETYAQSLSVSGRTAFGAGELAKGYQELAAAGVKATALMEALPIVADLAQSGEMDLTKATNVLTQSMGAFGKTTSTITDPSKYAAEMLVFSNAIVAISNDTQASVESAADSLVNKAGPAAKQYGMTIQELTAIIGTYATAGKLGAEAGSTTMRGIQLLTNSFARHKDVWKQEGIDIVDTTGKYKPYIDVIGLLDKRMQTMEPPAKTDLLMRLGLRNLSQDAIKPLIGARAEYDRIFAEISKGGQAAQTAAIQMEAFNNQMKVILYNPLENLKIDLFNLFKDTLLQLAKAVGEIVKEFQKLKADTKKTIVIIAGALALIGPILLIVGTAASIAVAGLSMLVGIFSSLSGFLVASGVIIVGFSLLESAMKNAFQVDFISFWEGLTGSMMKFATAIPGFLENFKQNMGTLFKWLSTQNLEGIIKVPLKIIGTALIGIMVVVGRELLVAMIPIGKFFWELFQGLVLYLRDSLAGMSWNPVTGFSWADRTKQAHDTYAQEVARAERHRKNAAGLGTIFTSKATIERNKKQAEEAYNYAVGVAAAKRDAHLKEVSGGEIAIGRLFNTVLDSPSDPLTAVGAILGTAGTDLAKQFEALNLPDFNYDVIKADAKTAQELGGLQGTFIGDREPEKGMGEEGLSDNRLRMLGKRRKGKISDVERLEGVAFDSAEAFSRIQSYYATGGAMLPLDRKIESTAQEQQRQIVELLSQIARNTMDDKVVFNTTNFADA